MVVTYFITTDDFLQRCEDCHSAKAPRSTYCTSLTAAQRNTPHLMFTSLQYCNVVVGTQREIMTTTTILTFIIINYLSEWSVIASSLLSYHKRTIANCCGGDTNWQTHIFNTSLVSILIYLFIIAVINMDEAIQQSESFHAPKEFCPRCGAVLSFPNKDSWMMWCKTCSYEIDARSKFQVCEVKLG